MQEQDSSDFNLDSYFSDLEYLKKSIVRVSTVNVNAQDLKNRAKKLVRDYFQFVRVILVGVFSEDDFVRSVDRLVQEFNNLCSGNGRKTSYQRVLTNIIRSLKNAEIEVHKKSAPVSDGHINNFEKKIIATLSNMIPTAAFSYQQALEDLNSNKTRVSYRGTSNELRECLREVLDFLAPDDLVTKSPGFKLEAEQKKPTQRQKIKFILKARGGHENAIKAPISAVEAVDGLIAAFGRSVFERTNIFAHVQTAHAEVFRLKAYVDVVLMELLEVSPK